MKAFIFDLDGTLVCTSREYRHDVVGKTLKDFNKKASERDMDRFWFEGGRDSLIRDCFGVDAELFWKAFKGYDNPKFRKLNTRAYNDVGFLKELRDKGARTGVVTAAPENISGINLELVGMESFDAVVNACNSLGVREKPDPEGIEICLERLGVAKNEAVYAGNSREDVLAAKRAGVLDVLVERGEYRHSWIDSSIRVSGLYSLRGL